MIFDILTLFPGMFAGPFDQSIISRARKKQLVDVNLHDLRKFAIDKRGTVDDRPYGGGVGMILRIEPIYQSLQSILGTRVPAGPESSYSKKLVRTILMDARGKRFTQAKAREYVRLEQLIIICGHYEGVDERVREYLVDEAVSIGDYVLTGGEIPAMVIVDAVTRLLPGVLEKPEAAKIESFSGLQNNIYSIYRATPYKERSDGPDLEYPQYTRPEEFMGWKVPEILLSGDHKKIAAWRDSTRPVRGK